MTAQDYTALSYHKRIRLLLQRGVCIADRKTGSLEYLLFQIDGFYIEACVTNGDLRCFDNTDDLDPYFKDITIPV